MKRFAMAITCVVLASGFSYGQESVKPNPNLKCYGPFLGTWLYEGPLLETVPDTADKGAAAVWKITWRRILEKNAVEGNWSAEVDGKTFAGKVLFGWHAGENRIAFGGMDAAGGMRLGTVTPDEANKSLTEVSQGVDAEGAEVTSTVVIKKTGKDSLTWQALDRKGGLLEGKSPVYTFKRVPRTAKVQPIKHAQPIARPQSADQAPPIKKSK